MSVVKQLSTDLDVSKGTHKEAIKLGYKDATVNGSRRRVEAEQPWQRREPH
jgi:hypothetical protein